MLSKSFLLINYYLFVSVFLVKPFSRTGGFIRFIRTKKKVKDGFFDEKQKGDCGLFVLERPRKGSHVGTLVGVTVVTEPSVICTTSGRKE